jgi:hypothetical protein
MKTMLMKGWQRTTSVRVADFYPVAGIVGIATYIFVECFLE